PDAIRMLGLGEFFTAYFVSGAVGYDKPRTEIYLHALREMENPENAYMIGDNPVADIKGAKLAGLKTVWVHPNDHPDGPAYADFICTELAEIPDVLA
ncbi:MAG: HAD family hydrolase, partial [Clostridia bacterium]|nr:HAD family hydrolase [Clostridia bacterium]